MAKRKRKDGADMGRAASSQASVSEEVTLQTPREKIAPRAHELVLATGVALLVLVRPWRDGITFPEDNTYFLWLILALAALYGARLLLRGEPLRFGRALLLLAAFWLVAALTGFNTIQVDATYRSMLFWTGHVLLFLVVSNGLRSKLAFGIVLGAFLATGLAEAFHSLVHLLYFLPQMRREVIERPELLALYFGSNELTPDLAHRLNSNRAFGSFLFPNALAAFLLLIVPACLGVIAQTYTLLRRPFSPPNETADHRLRVSTLIGLSIWCVGVFTALFYYGFFYMATYRDLPWSVHWGRWALYAGLLPLLAGAAPIVAIRLYGVERGLLVLRGLALPIVAIFSLISLWLTYSRGGTSALILAALITAALLIRAARTRRDSAAPASHTLIQTAMMLLLTGAAAAACGLAFRAPDARAQDPAPAPVAASPAAQAPPASGQTPPASGQAPPASGQTPAQAPGGPPKPQIIVDGQYLTAKQLANPASFWLRLSYWKTGLRMAAGYFWTGVGLGNFGTAYPKFQYLGAGEVKQAHNDFLQMLCETGPLGCLAFGLFWLYVAVWGARRIMAESDLAERLLLAGLYVSVLAFLVHSLVDFNFFNPSLASLAFVLAGLFFMRAAPAAPPAQAPRWKFQLTAVVLLVLTALAGGASVRIYRFDSTIGSSLEQKTRYAVAEFMLTRATPEMYRRNKPPAQTAKAVELLIPDRAALARFGTIQAPLGGQEAGYRAVGQEEEIPPDSVLVVTNPAQAQIETRKGIDAWLAQLERGDAMYPYSPELAAYIYQWYDLLEAHTTDPQEKKSLVLACQKWSQAAVDRSPEQAIYRECLGNALWRRGVIETGTNQIACYRQGLEQFQEATRLYPVEPYVWRNYGGRLDSLGKAYIEAGDPKTGEALRAEGRTAVAKAEELEKKRAELLRPKRRKPA